MLGLGVATPARALLRRRAAAGLGYDPVLILYGDSQAHGTSDDAASAIAGYAADAKVKVLNDAGQFVQYAPGSIAGLSYGVNSSNPGCEIGFIAKFRAAYPGVTLRIIKYGAPGSFQTRSPALGTCTGSISGNLLTVTSAAGTYPGDNVLITGSGVPTGVYVAFRNGSTNQFYVYQTGSSSNPNLNVASTTITKYNHAIAWSTSEGGLFEGGSGGTNGFRATVPAALAAMTSGGLNPRVIAVLRLLGTNDMAYAASAALFQTGATAMVAREKAAWPLSQAKIILPRVTSEAGSGSTTVRAAQQAVADGDAQVFLLDADGLGKSADGTHFNAAGLRAIGERAYDIWAGTSAGI